jgi:hypothetical protein
MSEEAASTTDESRSSSRRTALKAGVGVGVGLLAWSGPTITSLGGTPAYAVGCTFATNVNLTGGCRNTDQAECGGDGSTIAYHPITPTLPPGYSVSTNIGNQFCNGVAGPTVTVTYPAGITCTVTMRIAQPPACTRTLETFVFGPDSTSPLVFTLPNAAQTGVLPSNSQYQLTLQCVTTGAQGCFD